MRGLDPRIHLVRKNFLRRRIDCRVISAFTRVFRRAMPGNDKVGQDDRNMVQDAQAGVAARCCAASASQRAMSAATSVLCDAGMRGHAGTLIHSR